MLKKLQEMEGRYNIIEKQISDPETLKDQKLYKELMQELTALSDAVGEYRKLRKLEMQEQEAQQMLEGEADQELCELAREDLKNLEKQKQELMNHLKLLIVPKDPLDLKNIIMEIRAGTGGEEAALFVADLFRMYCRYAEVKKWKIEIITSNATGIGGFKEIIFSIAGKNVYANLRYESGVHRVQRVPVTESGGRIHTSAVTVAVLPEAEATDIEIKSDELRIDVFRSSGPGGQSVNTTDSAVRITHLPSGMVVTCQDEKSQQKNKVKALRVLRARLYELEEQKKHAVRAAARKTQVGSGDRSERIRTYNFPQNRLTDHRANLTLYKLDLILEGDLSEIIDALKINAKEQFFKSTG